MSAAVGMALASILIPLACVGWNTGLPARALRPWVERFATGGSVALAVVSFIAGAPAVLGIGAFLISSALFTLTFLSRLPHQRPAVAVGDSAPDFALYDSQGVARRLSDYAGEWVVLKFHRGYWCPYCVRELHDWEEQLDGLATRRTRLIAISTDRVDELREFHRKTGLRMTLLADPANLAIRLYNLQNRNFTPRRGPFRELAIPTTLLIDDHGTVRWLDQASDFRTRRSAQEVMARIDMFLPGAPFDTCDVCAVQEPAPG